jgi:hypothetical protein
VNSNTAYNPMDKFKPAFSCNACVCDGKKKKCCKKYKKNGKHCGSCPKK